MIAAVSVNAPPASSSGNWRTGNARASASSSQPAPTCRL